MAKAYWINTYRSINDPAKLAAYASIAGPVIEAAGGTFLACGLPAQAYELGIIECTTLIESESVGAATHESAGHQEALRALDGGAERDLRIIEAEPV